MTQDVLPGASNGAVNLFFRMLTCFSVVRFWVPWITFSNEEPLLKIPCSGVALLRLSSLICQESLIGPLVTMSIDFFTLRQVDNV